MEKSRIESIFFCTKEDNILGLVVKRATGTERYDYDAETWSKLVNELIRTYPDIIEGLDRNKESDRQEIINRFQKSKHIITVNDDIIVKLTKFGDSDNRQFVISYASGKARAFGLSDFSSEREYADTWQNYKETYCETYGYDVASINDEFMAKKNNLNIITKKNKKALLALLTAGGIALGPLSGGLVARLTTSLVSKPKATSTQMVTENPTLEPTQTITTPTITPTVTPTPTVIPTPTVAPTVVPTPASTYPYITMSPSERNLANANTYTLEEINPNDPNLLLRIMTPDINKILTFDDARNELGSEYLDFDYLVENVSNPQMSMLSNYVYDGIPLPDEVAMIYFENFFTNPVDRAYIQYFSDYRNEIIHQIYRENDVEAARSANNKALYELLRCFYNRQPLELEINGQRRLVDIAELTPEAQNALFRMAEVFYFMQGEDVIIYDGRTYNQDDIGYLIFGQEPEESPVK